MIESKMMNAGREAPADELPDTSPFARDVYCILGLPFDLVGVAEATRYMQRASAEGRRCFLSTPNLNFSIACLDDPKFRLSVIQSDLSVIDGMPLVWIAKALRLPFRERVAGSTLFETLRQESGKNGVAAMKVYFFGGPPGVAERAGQKLNADDSSMRAVGFDSPGFGSVEQMSNAAAIQKINDSGADFLVVALGAKKGQAWIQHNLSSLRVPLVSHLGAVVNFVAGTVSRAPIWIQKSGLEWIWRIKEEPGLWRRYWNDGVNLLRLLFSNIIPAAAAARRSSLPSANFACAEMALYTEGGRCRLRLSGAVGHPNIARLKVLLDRAARSDADFVLDCSALANVDSAAIGSLILLYGTCLANQRAWSVINVPIVVRRQFELHCAQYLLEPVA